MKLDLHVHSQYSNDGVLKPEHLLHMANKRGIGFAITDHNTCTGWQEFKRLNKKFSVPLVFGEEIKVYRSGKYLGEVIGLFMQEEVGKGEVDVVLDGLKGQDALVVLPHPFDYLRRPLFSPTKELGMLLEKAHAIEVFNSRMCLNSFNEKAQRLAEVRGVGIAAGSDAHFASEFGNAYLILKSDSLEEARREIKKGAKGFFGRLSPCTMHLFTVFAKLGLIRDNWRG